MRSCLTQITKVFRKKSTNNNIYEDGSSETCRLNNSENEKQLGNIVDQTTSKPANNVYDKKIGNETKISQSKNKRKSKNISCKNTNSTLNSEEASDTNKDCGNRYDDNDKNLSEYVIGTKIGDNQIKKWKIDDGGNDDDDFNNDETSARLNARTSVREQEKCKENIDVVSDCDVDKHKKPENEFTNSPITIFNKHNEHANKTKSITYHNSANETPIKHTYIDEYKTFVEETKNLPLTLSTPYPEHEISNFEDSFTLVAIEPKPHRKQSNLTDINTKLTTSISTPTITIDDYDAENEADITTAAKTPEEIEYEAKVAAESEDVMTPLPSSNTNSFSFGRNMQPEIIEIIRNLDSNALRINNLTLEDKFELVRRLEGQQQQHNHQHQQQQQRRHSRSKSRKVSYQLSNESDGRGSGTGDISPEINLCRNLIKQLEQEKENYEITMTQLDNLKITSSSLYERRQPKTPKLKLFVKAADAAKCPKKFNNRINADSEHEQQKNLMDLKYPTVLPPNPQLKALLVFHKADNICEVLVQACHRQQLDVTVVKSKEAALECLTNANVTTTATTTNTGTGTTATNNINSNSNNTSGSGGGGGSINTSSECFHLIIIDARSSKYLDAEYITRSIRHTNGHHFTTVIAVVKKSFFEKDDVLIALLDAGVNRCMVETTNLALCSVELKQILHSIVRPHNVMSTQQALYTALHRLKEVLIITDDLLRIQYANKSAERLLNMRLDEIISKPLAEIFISDVSSIGAHGKPVREFDGILTVRRKSQDGIPMHVRVVPVACIGRTPTHFIFNFDVPGGQTDFIATLPQPKEAPRGSLHSIRRGSFDVRSVASDGLRRTSLAKLTSLPLEAPITKIINLLSQVQENCSADEARLIDKVLEFLKREGLYSPQMKELRPDDPIATDLIGALLTGPSLYSSRRSSNDSIIRVSTARTSSTMPAKMKSTPLIMELLEESLSWEFDILKLEDITERHPLLYLGMEMFRRFNVFETFNVDENVCKGWLAVIEANYHAKNSYHNSTHAADVMQATGAFLSQLTSKDMGMDSMDEVTALIAAAAHDIDHPGRSSAFLCNSNSPLAILYNDLTVLESHHAATTFKLTLEDEKINIFKNLDKDTYKSVRSTIIDMILATEMTRHFEHLAKFVSVFGTDVEPRDIVHSEDESSILIRRMLIKVADVSNPARPTAFCVEWARRIAEEYFMQTDEEKARALPIVMPMFDRATCSIPKSQIGFIEYIIQDMMHAWDSFIDMPQLITYMQINYSQWKKYEEQGILTLADIKSKQATLNAKKGTCK